MLRDRNQRVWNLSGFASALICGLMLGLSLTALAEDGVGAGGGGGATPEPAATQTEIRYILGSSKPTLLAWLNRLEYFHKSQDHWEDEHPDRPKPSPQLMAKLFGSTKDVFQVVGEAFIEARSQSACRDRAGQEVDGSANARTICMSLPRLASKLTRSNYVAQTEALLLHEITHLMGGDEDEAVYIQNLALNDLRLDPDFVYRFLGGAQETWDLDQQLAWMLKADDAELAHLTSSFESSFAALGTKLLSVTLTSSMVRALTYDAFDQYEGGRASALRLYVCSRDPHLSAGERKNCADQYASIFGARTQMPAGEFEARMGNRPGDDCCSKHIQKVMIHKIVSPATLRGEIRAYKVFLQSVGFELEDLVHAQFPVTDRE